MDFVPNVLQLFPRRSEVKLSTDAVYLIKEDKHKPGNPKSALIIGWVHY